MAVSVVEFPLQIVSSVALTLTVGGSLVIPENAILGSVSPVAEMVCAVVFVSANFTQGKLPLYVPMAMADSVPVISVVGA